LKRHLTVAEVIELHRRLIATSGDHDGIRDFGRLEAAIAQPRMTFDGQELYPTLVTKVSALGFFIIQNHPFVDGNKRAGHAAMETCLMLNGFEIRASVDEQEQVVLGVAAGEIDLEEFTAWIDDHLVIRDDSR
jgi:death-on-curing protein